MSQFTLTSKRTVFGIVLALLALCVAGAPRPAHAVIMGDLVFCDVDGDGVYDPNNPVPELRDYPLDGVSVHVSCLSQFGVECFSSTEISGQLDLSSPSTPTPLSEVQRLCGPYLTWDPTVDSAGRYLVHPYPSCTVSDGPWTCTFTLDPSTFPPDCALASTPRLGGPPADGNGDGILCDLGTDGPFPEDQPLGNMRVGQCSSLPDVAPPADLTFVVTVTPVTAEPCAVYADFGLTPASCASDQECDDGDPCTDDVCDPRLGCSNPYNQAPCDDGDLCTPVDTCDGQGTCVGSGSTCGDGVLQGSCGEECDDGSLNSDTTADACRLDCTLPGCGDGVIDSGEQCDDGSANSDTTPDACRTDCTLAVCGDGVVDTGEECDDGPLNSDSVPGACSTTCISIRCGNGVIEVDEQCDDGVDNSDSLPDACRVDCTLAGCGDGVIDTGEQCDDGPLNSDTVADSCRLDCSLPRCGDGVLDSGELCDNGALNSDTAADACRTDCTLPRCGDGAVDSGEQCDDGVLNSDTTPDACRTDCSLPVCGDGVVDTGKGEECEADPSSEICDDGIDNDGDTSIDCDDPDCGPDASGQPCGGACNLVDCKPILKDPAIIRSAEQPGFLRLHGRVRAEPGSIDPTVNGFALQLSNELGSIYRASVPAEAFQRFGTKRFRFLDKSGRSGGGRFAGLYKVSARYRRDQGQTFFAFRIKAYADFSQATMAEMTTQVYGVDDVGFIHATWKKTKRGWVLRNKFR